MNKTIVLQYQNGAITKEDGSVVYELSLSPIPTDRPLENATLQFLDDIIDHMGLINSKFCDINLFHNYENKLPAQLALAELAGEATALARQLSKSSAEVKDEHFQESFEKIISYGYRLSVQMRKNLIDSPVAFGLQTYWINEIESLRNKVYKKIQESF